MYWNNEVVNTYTDNGNFKKLNKFTLRFFKLTTCTKSKDIYIDSLKLIKGWNNIFFEYCLNILQNKYTYKLKAFLLSSRIPTTEQQNHRCSFIKFFF